MKKGIYAYAVLEKRPKVERYLKKTGLRSMSEGGLLLVYKQVDVESVRAEIEKAAKNLAEIGKLLQKYEKVIEDLSAFGAVIPFRFGTVFKNSTLVVKLLKGKSIYFKTTLGKIASKEEWGVRVYKDEKVFKKNLLRKEKSHSALRGTEYLQRVKEEKDMDQKAFEFVENINREITGQAEKLSALVGEDGTGRQIIDQKDLLLSRSFLINAGDRKGFKNQMSVLRKKYQKMGINLEVSGPWPPYSFV